MQGGDCASALAAALNKVRADSTIHMTRVYHHHFIKPSQARARQGQGSRFLYPDKYFMQQQTLPFDCLTLRNIVHKNIFSNRCSYPCYTSNS